MSLSPSNPPDFPPIESVALSDIRNTWQELCTLLTVDGAVGVKWWDIISTGYSETARHYHTLTHIGEMISAFNRFRELVSEPSIVLLSIFFHDLVYIPKSSTNEEDSAAMFMQFVQESGQPAMKAAHTVHDYIIQTKTHKPGGGHGSDGDARLFLDFDMAVLGKPPAAYDQYAFQIRQEYSHVPYEQYCPARASVLRGFLGMTPAGAPTEEEGGEGGVEGEEEAASTPLPPPAPIYVSSSTLASGLEPLARANILREIRELERGVILGQQTTAAAE